MIRHVRLSSRHSMSGAATVEYAVTVIFWVAMTLGVMEFGRAMYMFNASLEATRMGARYAVVCSFNEQAVKDRMTAFLPILTDGNITINYAGAACSTTSCPSTSVMISNVTFGTIIPLAPVTLTLPPAQTSMVPETRRTMAGAVCS